MRDIGQWANARSSNTAWGEEGLCCKTISLKMMMTVFRKEAPANFVPAAAVKRRGLVLFNFTGRKAHEGCLLSFY